MHARVLVAKAYGSGQYHLKLLTTFGLTTANNFTSNERGLAERLPTPD